MSSNIDQHYTVVEQAISKLGIDGVKSRNKTNSWTVFCNGQPIFLYLTLHPKSNTWYFHAGASIIETPTEQEGAFCKQLLQLNSQLLGVFFIEKKGMIYLYCMREAQDLDISEAYAIIAKVGNYADYYIRSAKHGLLNWTAFNADGPEAVGAGA